MPHAPEQTRLKLPLCPDTPQPAGDTPATTGPAPALPNTPKPKAKEHPKIAATVQNMGIAPYWREYSSEASRALWFPAGIGLPGAGHEISRYRPEETAGRSWFRINRYVNPAPKGTRIFPPTTAPEPVAPMDHAATESMTRKIRFYPTRKQQGILNLWCEGARWCYNFTIETVWSAGIAANWKKLKTAIIHAVPERLKAVPYQVRSVAVRDACQAISACRRFNRKLARDQKRRQRLQQDWARPRFRSRKNPSQGCFIPSKAVFEYGLAQDPRQGRLLPGKPVYHHGTYRKILGPLQMAEAIPADAGDSRITRRNGRWHLAASCPARRRRAETQGRVVALDPGIRTFLTWFSENDAGFIAKGAFGRIQRLCAHLDDLLSQAKLEQRRYAKHNQYRAAARIRNKIHDLIDELHHKAARFLVDRFDLILLPTFETGRIVRKGQRKMRAKSVRSLLTFAHYRFQRFLAWKCWQTGKALMLVNEAYTSKTCSWSGEIISKLGGRKVIMGSDGIRLDRDINGARGIFLRALGDSPALRGASATEAARGSVG